MGGAVMHRRKEADYLAGKSAEAMRKDFYARYRLLRYRNFFAGLIAQTVLSPYGNSRTILATFHFQLNEYDCILHWWILTVFGIVCFVYKHRFLPKKKISPLSQSLGSHGYEVLATSFYYSRHMRADGQSSPPPSHLLTDSVLSVYSSQLAIWVQMVQKSRTNYYRL